MAKVAIVAASGFEQSDMTALCQGLVAAGHQLAVVSPKKQSVRAWDNTHWGADLPVDTAALEADAGNYDGLAVPGGLIHADTLRADAAIVGLVRKAVSQGKPVAALGHGVWVLVEAGLAKGRAMTGAPAIRTDVANAGGHYRDTPVIDDRMVLTARASHDAGEFTERLCQLLA